MIEREPHLRQGELEEGHILVQSDASNTLILFKLCIPDRVKTVHEVPFPWLLRVPNLMLHLLTFLYGHLKT